MIPLRVHLKGFMSYGDEATLSFDGGSLWVLSGPNGAGKSAIFDAITFALYGIHRAGSQHAKDLINHNADALVVEFDFLVDGKEYRVRRTVSRQGNPTRQAFFLVSENPEPIPDTDRDEGFKEWVKNTIGLEYKTFTSSVILLQGESEKLLAMTPGERHKALSELMDLTPYANLCKAAGERAQHHKSLADHHGGQLDNTPAVSNEELSSAEDAAEQAEKAYREAGDRVEELNKLVGRAESWERMSEELAQRQGELEKAQCLLDREREIRENAGRLRQLEQTLPVLESFVGDKERLADNERDEAKARERRHGIQSDLEEANKEKTAADQEVERLAGVIEERKTADASLAELIGKLKPKAEHLERLNEAQAELDEAKEKLNALPPDLEQTIENADEEAERLSQAYQALPLLKQLVQARSSLGEAMLAERRAGEEIETNTPLLRESENETERLRAQVVAAREEVDELNHRVTRDKANHENAQERRSDFDDASKQPTCGLCGQEITEQHASQEMARLDVRVAEAKKELENSKDRHEQATGQLKALQEESGKADAAHKELQEKLERLERDRGQAELAMRRHAEQAENSFENLPDSYRTRIAPQVPQGAEWTTTVYPTDAELEGLKKEVAGREAHASHLRELREQLGVKQRCDESCNSASRRLSKLLETLSWDEARAARDDLATHQTRSQELRSEVVRLGETHRDAVKEAEKRCEMVEKSNRDVQKNEGEIQSLQAARKEIEHALRAIFDKLPDDWRKRAESVGSEELATRREERDGLERYEELLSDLDHATRSRKVLEERIAKLDAWIDEIPTQARRPAAEIDSELTDARSLAEQRDAERGTANKHFDELGQRREQRQELENSRREAERQRRAYGTLHNLLGPRRLQARLLRAAEVSLVSLANETLDGLSRGRMRLKLREGDGQEKALDLVVHDSDTGSKPVSVSLTSGSQRFRIAVSLALAIGRYKGQQARRIQSVIIDEGFGSLDKNSRDDMISVLSDLQQDLDRIILVSHQDEFANAFTNGYAVSLEDNSSKVELLQT